jgi:hypothetical protein
MASEGGDFGFVDLGGSDAFFGGGCEFVGNEGVEFAEFLGRSGGGGHEGEEASAEFGGPLVFGVVEDPGFVFSGAAGDLDEGGVDGIDAGAGHEADEEAGGHGCQLFVVSC